VATLGSIALQGLNYEWHALRPRTSRKDAKQSWRPRRYFMQSADFLAHRSPKSPPLALIYHYYPSKEDILFDVMDSHIQSLVQAAREIEATAQPPEQKIRAIAAVLMRLYEGAQSNQKVLLNELGNLPTERRAIIIDHQRQLIDLMDGLLLLVRPDLSDKKPHRRALVMMFFGMVNFTHTWFDPAGPIPSSGIASIAADMFIAGLRPSSSS
jgi:AcrR family transcriptional regulator